MLSVSKFSIMLFILFFQVLGKCLFPGVPLLKNAKCGCIGENHIVEIPHGESSYDASCQTFNTRKAAFDLVLEVVSLVPKTRAKVVNFFVEMHSHMNFDSLRNIQTHGRRPPMSHIGLRNPGNHFFLPLFPSISLSRNHF